MLYTTYFAKLRNLPADIVPVAICGKAPNGFTGLQYKKLAPKWGFFSQWKKNHDNHYYVRCFNEQVLDPLDAQTVFNEIKDLAGGAEDIALVCYERPEAFCHRHLVANWFRENNIPIVEYGC